MPSLSKEEVNHVADLARLNINQDEYELYGKQLYDILEEINKINDVKLTTDEIMISSIDFNNRYSIDEIKSMLNKEEIFKNVKHSNGDFIVVPKVLDE